MDQQHWPEVENLLNQALRLENSQRPEFLARIEDRSIRVEVESLLNADDAAGFPVPSQFEALFGANLLNAETELSSAAIQNEAIGPYRLLQMIGTGGMGEVWLAEQKSPVRRRVAVKLIKTGMDTHEVLKRFESELQALALMDHPAIAKVFEAGTTPQGRPYFAMEYVPGLAITNYCDKHKLTIQERLELFRSVCEGVQHAHQKAVIHRDLKPSNILVIEVNGKATAKIIDFGVAKAIGQRLTAETMFTRLGTVVGTPEYMSPEQADSAGEDIDTRADVYSLGVVLYELLVGTLPLDYRKLAFDEILRTLRDKDAPTPSTRLSTLGGQSDLIAQNRRTEIKTLSRQLRGDLDCIALKALEKNRNRRYGSAVELAADIERYLQNTPVSARRAGVGYRARKYIRRHRIGVAAAGALVVLLVAFSVAQTFQLRRTIRERDRANRVTEFMTTMFKVSDPSEARGNTLTAREILDKASKEINTGLARDPEVQAQMMYIMGKVYEGLGLYSKSESLLSAAVNIRRRQLGPKNTDTLLSMYWLAQVLTDEGHFAEAEKLCRETLDLRRRELGSGHRDTISSLSMLGWILNNEGRYAEAEKLNREALEAAKQAFGPEDKSARKAMLNLAIDFAYEGKYAESEKAFRDLLEIERRVDGPDHPNVLDDMNNLAATLQHEKNYAAAEKLYIDLIQTKRRVLGPEHPHTLTSMGNLASVLSGEKRYAEAERLFRETLEIKRRSLGPEHRSTLVTMGNLANVLTKEARYSEAERLLRQTLETEQRTLGPRHYDSLVTLENLGDLLKGEKRYSESEKAFRETFEERNQALGPGHPDTATAAYNLACVLALKGKQDEAFSNLQYAVEHNLPTDTRRDLEKDTDLISLHGDPRFAKLVASARQRAAGLQASK